MFSALDLLLGFAGVAVSAAIALACWLLAVVGSRRPEQVPATVRAQADRPLVHAGNSRPPAAAEPVLESR